MSFENKALIIFPLTFLFFASHLNRYRWNHWINSGQRRNMCWLQGRHFEKRRSLQSSWSHSTRCWWCEYLNISLLIYNYVEQNVQDLKIRTDRFWLITKKTKTKMITKMSRWLHWFLLSSLDIIFKLFIPFPNSYFSITQSRMLIDR